MKSSEFRAELQKLMPGYRWTIHSGVKGGMFYAATGIQTSGSNRLSTLHVERRDNYAASGLVRYEVKSAGYGTRSPWLHAASDKTLASALRALQQHYERTAAEYGSHASALQVGRAAKGGEA